VPALEGDYGDCCRCIPERVENAVGSLSHGAERLSARTTYLVRDHAGREVWEGPGRALQRVRVVNRGQGAEVAKTALSPFAEELNMEYLGGVDQSTGI
jgi:hypothetical protein